MKQLLLGTFTSLALATTSHAQDFPLSWARSSSPLVNRVNFASNGDVLMMGRHGTQNVVLERRAAATGDVVWSVQLVHSTIYGLDMDVDGQDNMYVYLYMTGGSADLDAGPGVAMHGPGKVFLKYDGDGNYVWGHSVNDLTGPSNKRGSISCDDAGNLYFSGPIGEGLHDFQPGPGDNSISVFQGTLAAVTVRYNTDGQVSWVRKVNFSGADCYTYDIAAYRDGSGIAVVYRLFNSGNNIDVDPGLNTVNIPSGSVVLLKYDEEYDYEGMSFTDYDYGKLAVDDNGDAFFAGKQLVGNSDGFWLRRYTFDGNEFDEEYAMQPVFAANAVCGGLVADGAGGAFVSYFRVCTSPRIGMARVNHNGNVTLSGHFNTGPDCDLPLATGLDLHEGNLALGTFGHITGDYDMGDGMVMLPQSGHNGVVAVYGWCTAAPSDPVAITAGPWCVGDTVTCLTSADGASSYTWNAGAWSIISGQGSNTVQVVPSSGSATITVQASNFCGTSGTTSLSATAASASAELPADFTECISYQGTLDPGPCAGCTYVWQPGGATTPTLNINISTTTTYTVTTTQGGCSATDQITITIDPCMSVEEPDATPWQLAPVPVQRGEALTISGLVPGTRIMIASVDGRMLLAPQNATIDRMEIPTATFAPGLYLLNADGRARRFVVQ